MKRSKTTKEESRQTGICFIPRLSTMSLNESIKGYCASNSLFEQKISEFVENNYTITEMAYHCNMSVTTFKKKFAEYYHTPPHYWQIKQHLLKASELLLSKDLSIKEICYKCNFHYLSHFISRFKREFGMTPKQYRNKYK
ncbi:MAG: helix-turn-helix transcriptional regulator [Rikenellaceae bacterium]|nr:helix-turn-helix transcriptional regulator [Rikenellaceae bacterium]